MGRQLEAIRVESLKKCQSEGMKMHSISSAAFFFWGAARSSLCRRAAPQKNHLREMLRMLA